MAMDESQKMFLQRQWDLLEGNKKLRTYIPTMICTLIIGICVFYFHGENFKILSQARWVFVILVGLIGCFGIWMLALIHRQYNYSNAKISYLYKTFSMDYLHEFKYPEDATVDKKATFEAGQFLFTAGYVVITFFTVTVVLSMLLIPNA